MGTPYGKQLREKSRISRKVLSPFNSLPSRTGSSALPAMKDGITWLEPYRSPEKGFRNKAKMVVSGSKKSLVLGLAPKPHFPNGVDLESCPLYQPAIQAAFTPIRQWLQRLGARPYNIAADKGELKYVLVSANPQGELMVRLVLRSKAACKRIENTWEELAEALPNLCVFSINIQPEHTTVIEGPEEIILSEQHFLTMPGVGADLQLAPGAFFQTNTGASTAMYSQAQAWAQQVKPESAWDLYCGVGGFAFALSAAGVPRVTGVEMVGPAITGAKRAATTIANQVGGTDPQDYGDSTEDNHGKIQVKPPHFITGDATKWIRNQKHLETPDLVVVNPPRRGLGPELATWLERSGIPHVIYSSCFQKTLVEDLKRMRSYRIREAKIVDMFPHTDHVETMCLLSKDDDT